MKPGGPLVRKTPLKRSGALPRVSQKQRSKQVARREAMAIVRERDQNTCQFWLSLVVWAQTTTTVDFSSGDGERIFAQCREAFPYDPPPCGGPNHGHEPKHRSQGGDPTDPDQIVLICESHHRFCHSEPIAAKLLGL